jgi:hypothetical protein
VRAKAFAGQHGAFDPGTAARKVAISPQIKRTETSDHPQPVGRHGGRQAAQDVEKGPWIMGDRCIAVDLLLASPCLWVMNATPDVTAIRDWVAPRATHLCHDAALCRGLMAAG